MTTLHLRKSIGRSPLRLGLPRVQPTWIICGFLLIPLLLVYFALLPVARAVSPAPDGGYPGGNTAEGTDALLNLTSGIWNTALGFEALNHDIAGKINTASGVRSLSSNTSGSNNTATGVYALYANTIGWYNNAVGAYSLANNISGNYNTASGYGALYRNTGSYNTANGFAALYSNTDGGANSAFGWDALASNTTGGSNTANGFQALVSNATGNYNTANGVGALFSNMGGLGNTANGDSALQGNTDGNDNTAVGRHALFNNITGSVNIAVGAVAGSSVLDADNVICIGANVSGQNLSNLCFIGNIYSNVQPIVGTDPDSVTITSSGRLGRGNGSSRRYKHDIKAMDKASEAIFALNPVSFRYNKEYDATQTLAFGLIAEEVAEVYPDLVGRNPEGHPESVRYEQINAMLLNEFLKEHRTVEEQGATIIQLKSSASKQEATITDLKSTVAKQQKDFQSTAARQEKEIKALTAGLNEQVSQIQKVSAQLAAASPSRGGLEVSEPAPQTVLNNNQ